MPETKRFGDLKKSIGSVSQKVLTSQLRDMEKNGLVNRKAYAEAGSPFSMQCGTEAKSTRAVKSQMTINLMS